MALNDNQWLEVKSARGLLSSQEEINQYGLSVQEETGWTVSSEGFSPIFGGNYSMCGILIEGNCYSVDPEDGDWAIEHWSIIYRIHSV